MRKFARQLDDWLKTALEDVPLPLQQTKVDCEYTTPAVHNITSAMRHTTIHTDNNTLLSTLSILSSLHLAVFSGRQPIIN